MRVLPLTTLLLLSACSAPSAINGPGPAIPVLAAAPTENKGVSSKLLSGVDLSGEVNLPGYQLRARAVTIEPGGYTAAHVHQGRPTQEYVAQGTVIEVRNGKPVQHAAGAMVQGVNGVHHWWENHGREPVVLIPVDIAKP